MVVITRILLACILLTLFACGGSSNSSSDMPEQTIPPSVSFNPSQVTVLSREEFFVVVFGEVNSIQTSQVDLTCTDGVMHNNGLFTAPSVEFLTEATCSASVSDTAGRTANAILSVTILPESNVGQTVGYHSPSLTLSLPNFNVAGTSGSYGQHIVSTRESLEQPGFLEVTSIGFGGVLPRPYYRANDLSFEGLYESVDFIQSSSLSAHGLPDASMSILSSNSNKMYWLVEDSQLNRFTIREEINIESPCYVAETNTLYANDLVIGQRDRGLSMFEIDTGTDFTNTESFDSRLVYSVGEGRSLCKILRGVIPHRFFEQYPQIQESYAFDPAFALPLTALDYNSNELVFYADIDIDNQLDEIGTLPIETSASGQLNIVDAITRGSPSLVPQYFLVLLSDGNHIGEHRIDLIYFDQETNDYVQTSVYEWNVGIPISLVQGHLGGSLERGIFNIDLAVILSSTEQSLFFDNLQDADNILGSPPLYGEPTLFEVGIGAGSAVLAEFPNPNDSQRTSVGVMVSFPENGELIMISLENLE